MKIKINKEELEFIIKDYYGIKGLEVESVKLGEEIEVTIKENTPPTKGEIQHKLRLSFLEKYYETFGEDAPYPFSPANPNEKKSVSLNFYGIKTKNL